MIIKQWNLTYKRKDDCMKMVNEEDHFKLNFSKSECQTDHHHTRPSWLI